MAEYLPNNKNWMGLIFAVAHVIVDRLPSDSIAQAALRIAIWALGIAVVTLIAVGAQILIAVRELKVVQRDFKLTQAQFTELSRRPMVRVGVGLQKPTPENPACFGAFFNLTNYGDKLSNKILVELLVEAKDLGNVNSGHLVASRFRQSAISLGEDAYAVFSTSLDEPLYPNGIIVAILVPNMMMREHVETSRLLFRVYDENFAYPAAGYGEVRFWREKPTPMKPLGVEESVDAIR